MPRSALILFFCATCFCCFAQDDPNTWSGGGVYKAGQVITSMIRSVGGDKKLVLQITPKGEVTGTLDATYDKTKASVSFKAEVADQSFLIGGRYDSARNLLLLVVTHAKATNSSSTDKRFENPDSLYYTTTVGRQQGLIEMTGIAHPNLNRNATNEWIGSSPAAMARLVGGSLQNMHILPLTIRLEKFIPIAEAAVQTPVPKPQQDIIQNPPPVTQKKEEAVAPPTVTPKQVETAATPSPQVEKRKTEIQHTIVLDTSLVKLDMYDNGEVDGDIATLILDGTVIVNSQLLSTKAVSVTLHISKEQPEHLLELYANNMGSIPPNTALLVITCNRKRYEINLSSNGTANGTVRLVFAKK